LVAGPTAADGWVRVGEPGAADWLDDRLIYSADRPPAVVEAAGRTAESAPGGSRSPSTAAPPS
jgi:hypothetical protein